MSGTAISHDALHQTVQQPASATPILVEDHLGLVMHLAKCYAGSYQGHHILDLEDLYQEGVLGLMHAAEKFDARKGFRFSTYATYWIRWAIGQAIMNESLNRWFLLRPSSHCGQGKAPALRRRAGSETGAQSDAATRAEQESIQYYVLEGLFPATHVFALN